MTQLTLLMTQITQPMIVNTTDGNADEAVDDTADDIADETGDDS